MYKYNGTHYSELNETFFYIHTYIGTYIIDHSPLGLFRANETNN